MKPIIITASSVSDALAFGLRLLSTNVERELSRNGGVSVWDGPVITHSLHPLRRVLFSPLRNANPFFHLFESLWMLGGRNDLPWVAQFNKQMATYSDDGGKTQPASYGHRWRAHFGHDQLDTLVAELKANPGTRRAVLAMWNPGHAVGDWQASAGDLAKAIGGSADVPCNTQCFFTVRDGKLHMAVTCRSNDILWGAHGANAVHFSILLEYMAAKCGLAVGEMTQFSWNYHLYDNILKHPQNEVAWDVQNSDLYTGRLNPVQPTLIFDSATMDQFEADLPVFLNWLDPTREGFDGRPDLEHPFLNNTALPMFDAWVAWKCQDVPLALEYCEEIEGLDWRIASTEWMQRKLEKTDEQ
jgi:thymidylate synthase